MKADLTLDWPTINRLCGRIRALEAELAEAKGPLLAAAKYHKEERVALRARAEKAEARVAELKQLAIDFADDPERVKREIAKKEAPR